MAKGMVHQSFGSGSQSYCPNYISGDGLNIDKIIILQSDHMGKPTGT